jgi:hypothetical protein
VSYTFIEFDKGLLSMNHFILRQMHKYLGLLNLTADFRLSLTSLLGFWGMVALSLFQSSNLQASNIQSSNIQASNVQASSTQTSNLAFTKPIAFQYKTGVIELSNSINLGIRSEENGDSTFDNHQVESQLSYATQLNNDWDLNVSYTANYANERFDSYQDVLRASVQDQWGEIVIGNISSIIYDRTRRQIAAGLLDTNLSITRDSFTLPLKRTGLFYQWQNPNLQLMFALDRQANIEIGSRYYKILNGNEIVISSRLNNIDNDIADAQGVSESQSYAIMFQLQRGRWVADLQYQQEKLSLLSSPDSLDLNTTSAGLNYSLNRWQWSVSAITKENELNDTEKTIAIGMQYDIARGLSLNFGASVNNTKLFPERFQSYAVSLKYDF